MKPQIHSLVAVTCVILIVSSFGTAIAEVREFIAGMASAAKPGAMESSAYTDADAAHVTFTNLSAGTVFQCVRAIVTSKAGKVAKSVAVCTGDVRPHSTVVLVAPYRPGEVRDMCSSNGQFGVKQLDWDLCTFDLEPTGPGT